MPSILNALDTIQQAFAAQQYALTIAQRNVANANDPFFTRQVVTFTPAGDEYSVPGIAGVSLRAVRDRFIDYSISQELQSLAEHDVTYNALQQIDAVFVGNGGQDLQRALSDFFNSFDALASAPENLILRQQVLEKANALTFEFHRLYTSIQRVQTFQDQAMTATVQEINSLTAKIADLNRRIAIAHGLNSEDEFILRDSRQQVVEQLSGLMDLSYFETESGSVTVTTRQGDFLVLEDQARRLELSPVPERAFQGVILGGSEITDSLQSGGLGGLLKLRDTTTAGYLSALDEMAAAIIARVNEQHAQGWDLDGLEGGDFFVPFAPLTPGSNAGAARTIGVALTDPRQIAAAAPDSGPGNNANARRIADIADETLCSAATTTLLDFYAGLIFRVGSDEKAAEEGITTQQNILDQLRNQRDAFSGVNLDEEAINIIKYQKAYQASARFASVLDALNDEILQLLGV